MRSLAVIRRPSLMRSLATPKAPGKSLRSLKMLIWPSSAAL